MSCDFDKKTKKPIGKGHEEYKKFKQNLIKKALESIKNLESKLEKEENSESKPQSFNQYLKEEIQKTLNNTLYKMGEKLLPKKSNGFLSVISSFANCSPSFSSTRSLSTRKFHTEVFNIYDREKEEEKREVKKDDDIIPKISCLPFSVKRIFSLKSNAITK